MSDRLEIIMEKKIDECTSEESLERFRAVQEDPEWKYKTRGFLEYRMFVYMTRKLEEALTENKELKAEVERLKEEIKLKDEFAMKGIIMGKDLDKPIQELERNGYKIEEVENGKE